MERGSEKIIKRNRDQKPGNIIFSGLFEQGYTISRVQYLGLKNTG